MPWRCSKCSWKYSDAYAADWGRTEASSGMGNQPVCTRLVVARGAPPARVRQPDGSERQEDPLEVCRGVLVPGALNLIPDDPDDALPIKVR